MLDDDQRRQLRFVGVTVGYGLLAALVLFLLWRLSEVLLPFFIAFILAVVLSPVVDQLQQSLQQRKLPSWLANRGVSTLIVYTLVITIIATLLFVLVPLVVSQIGEIVAAFRTRFLLDKPTADLGGKIADQIQIFGRRYSIPAVMIAPLTMQAKNSAQLLTRGLETFGNLLLGFLPNLIYVILVPIIAFYALIDYHLIFAKMLLLFPRNHRDDVRHIANDVTGVFGNYLRGLSIVCLFDGITTTILLTVFPATRPFAAALGLIAGLLYAVPFLGSAISVSLAFMVALVSPIGSPQTALTIALCSLAIRHIGLDQLVSPRLIGKQVGLHPILMILALISGNTLFGIGGLLLAVPVAASIQVIIVHLEPRLARRVNVAADADTAAHGDDDVPVAIGDATADALKVNEERVPVTTQSAVDSEATGGVRTS